MIQFSPRPVNEPIKDYAPRSVEKLSLKKALSTITQNIEIPCVIGGKRVFTSNKKTFQVPHALNEVAATAHFAGEKELKDAASAALKAKAEWEALSPNARAAIFLKAADLLAGPWRDRLNAATMMGQSKTVYQAEIDAACELIDFLRFNVAFYEKILNEELVSSPGIWNRMDYRPLEGFVLAITPFNFTAIGANLVCAPALVGNTVVWKPSDGQLLSAWYTYLLLEEAGVPPGVINFVPADGPLTGKALLMHPDLAGIHFTGSTATFRHILQTVGTHISGYKNYPRVVGETGGKDFIFADASADAEALAVAAVRGAFEFQGQKCSAASRMYIPRTLWQNSVRPQMEQEISKLKMGDVRDFRNFMGAVTDERAFNKISGFIERAKKESQLIAGGKCDRSKGWFIEPTLIEASNPKSETMIEEIFGPVLTVYPYDEKDLEKTLALCDQSTSYALTGAVFSQDRNQIERMSRALRNAAGNFYINDKPTGAVVGQQPFGGARASGTNDKAGSPLNLLRWMSPRVIKENFVPPKQVAYVSMQEE